LADRPFGHTVPQLIARLSGPEHWSLFAEHRVSMLRFLRRAFNCRAKVVIAGGPGSACSGVTADGLIGVIGAAIGAGESTDFS
jgi:hypothetical protein